MYYMYNIIGDELPLNFGSKISVIYNFTREITKLPWQPSVRPVQKVPYVYVRSLLKQNTESKSYTAKATRTVKKQK